MEPSTPARSPGRAPRRFARATLAALAATAAALAPALLLADGGERRRPTGELGTVPGQPAITFVAPRNGASQPGRAVMVTVAVENFKLAPAHFGGEPLLGEGHIRFSLNRVPDCVVPAKLRRALASPMSNGRLTGASFDYARYAGPNGVLAERIGTAGDHSPATRPEIFYRHLPAGFYRLVATLAQNNGTAIGAHAVTNFRIEPRHGQTTRPCPAGMVSSARAARR